jgi:hypothetical protein
MASKKPVIIKFVLAKKKKVIIKFEHGISLLYDKEYKSRLEMHHSKQSKVALKNEPTF